MERAGSRQAGDPALSKAGSELHGIYRVTDIPLTLHRDARRAAPSARTSNPTQGSRVADQA
jgi:hypothetical protein